MARAYHTVERYVVLGLVLAGTSNFAGPQAAVARAMKKCSNEWWRRQGLRTSCLRGYSMGVEELSTK